MPLDRTHNFINAPCPLCGGQQYTDGQTVYCERCRERHARLFTGLLGVESWGISAERVRARIEELRQQRAEEDAA